MDRWTEIEVFVQIAESGSISRAAEALGISVSATSRYLMALEERLNIRLVQRTTRQLSLTGEGEVFCERCRDILGSMKEAEASVSEAARNPTGLLRVQASLSFCLLHLEPLIPAFTERYPRIRVEIVAANRYLDIIENGIDVAVRTRRVEADSQITIRRLAQTRRLLAATPGYLEHHGTPEHPEDLARHRLILYTLADNWTELRFRKGTETITVPVNGALNANDGQLIRHAALDDLGILAQPTYIIQEDLAAGRLVRVLDDWDLPRLTMNIAYPTKAFLPAKTRLFIDFLVEDFRQHDYERLWTA
ncbi:LysR family transcriptional regulator [Amaricoccus sp. W119]|uniref:LysR family transcriptional regulator n=1 Tax=Amaricoccus sp. W119 TaxID=3391833 RepID=UPI0039A6FA7C